METILGLLNNLGNPYNHTETKHRKRRHLESELSDMLNPEVFMSLSDVETYTSDYSKANKPSTLQPAHANRLRTTEEPSVAGRQVQHTYMLTTLRLLADNIRLRNDISKLYKGIHADTGSKEGALDSNDAEDDRNKRDTDALHEGNDNTASHQDGKKVRHQHGKVRHDDWEEEEGGLGVAPGFWEDVTSTMLYANLSHGNDSVFNIYFGEGEEEAPGDGHGHSKAETLLEIAHVLHYCSIAILGIFVVQVC